MTIRLVLVDDHPVVRDGLQAIIETQPDLEVVGEAGTGAEALAVLHATLPDVVILDLALPDFDGVAVLEQIHTTLPQIRVLVFTAFDTDERIFDAIRAGAQGYLLKGSPRNELFQAIRTLYAGHSTLQPVIASRLIRQVQADLPAVELTPREYEVLRLVAEGATNKIIAQTLTIAERTVKFHLSSVMRKLAAANRTEAVALAREYGLIP